MVTSQFVKKNISGIQVIKTLQLMMENNYTMSQLTEALNKNEGKPIISIIEPTLFYTLKVLLGK